MSFTNKCSLFIDKAASLGLRLRLGLLTLSNHPGGLTQVLQFLALFVQQVFNVFTMQYILLFFFCF